MLSCRFLPQTQMNVFDCMIWVVGLLLLIATVEAQSPQASRRVASQAEEIYIARTSGRRLMCVQMNLESQRRQYDLVGEARRLGFRNIEVIDDNLGRSATGTVARPGFEKLVAWLAQEK